MVVLRYVLDYSPGEIARALVFVHVARWRRVAAVSRIARQFGIRSTTGGFPRLEGWCCMVGGGAE